MKNSLDDTPADTAESPLKKIKLEDSLAESDELLSPSVVTTTASPSTSISGRGRGRGRARGRGRGRGRVGITKSTTEGRAQELLSDPRITAVDPRQVLCRMCGSWIKLFKHTDYAPANWRTHADKCEIRSQWKQRVKQEPGTIFELPVTITSTQPGNIGDSSGTREVSEAIVEQEKDYDSAIDETDGYQDEPIRHSNIPRRGFTAAERRQKLLDDDRLTEVQAHQVMCGMCKTWVRLHNIREYDTYNWRRHAERCEVISTMPEGSARKRKRVLNMSSSEAADGLGHNSAFETLDNDGTPPNYDNQGMCSGEPTPPSSVPSPTEPSLSAQLPPSTQIKQELSESTSMLEYPSIASGSISSVIRRKKKRKARGVEERRKSLLDDPRCGEVQPGEVLCLMCRNWIKLYKDVPYIDANWTRHAERCQTRHGANFTYHKPTEPENDAASEAALEDSELNEPDDTNAPLPLELEPESSTSGDNYCSKCEKSYEGSRLRHEILCNQPQLAKKFHGKGKLPVPAAAETSSAPVAATADPPTTLPTIIPAPEQPASISAPAKNLDCGNVNSTPGPSTASGIAKGKDGRSPEQRRQELLNDARCEQVEMYRVFCKMCERHIGLHAKKEYSTSNWYKHAKSCEAKNRIPKKRKHQSDCTPEVSLVYPPDGQSNIQLGVSSSRLSGSMKVETDKGAVSGPSGTKSTSPTECPMDVCESTSALDATAQDSISMAKGGMRKRYTAHERHERLKADPRIKVIEPHQLQCGLCDKWIRLQSRTEYDIHNWLAHVDKCELRQKRSSMTTSQNHVSSGYLSEGRPTSRRVSEQQLPTPPPSSSQLKRVDERIDELASDDRCAKHEPHRVLCKMCNQWIKLRDEQPYVLYNWHKHVASCTRRRSGVFSAPVTRLMKQETVEPSLDPPKTSYSFRARQPVLQPLPPEPEKTEIFDPQYTSAQAPDSRRKTDAEREAFLRADPRQDGVERGKVFCKMCQSWVRLNTASGFLPGNWLRHAERCQKRNGWAGPVPTIPVKNVYIPPEVIDLVQEDEETGEIIPPGTYGYIELGDIVNSFEPTHTSLEYGPKLDALSTPTPVAHRMGATSASTSLRDTSSGSALLRFALEANHSATQGSKRPHRGMEYRKQELEMDPRTKVVEPDRILCAMCDRWIATRRDVDYSGQNWAKHAGICEVKTGWLKRYKDGLVDTQMPVSPIEPEVQDENIPYSARKQTCVDYIFYKPDAVTTDSGEADRSETPSISTTVKPVEWSPESKTDDIDSDDDEVAVDIDAVPAEMVKKYLTRCALTPTQAQIVPPIVFRPPIYYQVFAPVIPRPLSAPVTPVLTSAPAAPVPSATAVTSPSEANRPNTSPTITSTLTPTQAQATSTVTSGSSGLHEVRQLKLQLMSRSPVGVTSPPASATPASPIVAPTPNEQTMSSRVASPGVTIPSTATVVLAPMSVDSSAPTTPATSLLSSNGSASGSFDTIVVNKPTPPQKPKQTLSPSIPILRLSPMVPTPPSQPATPTAPQALSKQPALSS